MVMNKLSLKTKRSFIITIILFILFIVFTLLIKTVNVQSIGPEGSSVGFASINNTFLKTIGYNDLWQKITELLEIFPFIAIGIFAVIGLVQLIKRKRLFLVDAEILLLGCVFVLILFTYLLFEIIIINYRPIILDHLEGLEASYPSSHTILSATVMIMSIIVVNRKLTKFTIKAIIDIFAISIAVITVIGRIVSGVHWITDIVAGILISSAFIMLYSSVLSLIDDRRSKFNTEKTPNN